MRVPLVQIDAFTDRLFAGNPAAVVPLPADPPVPTELMQAVAGENNLSETAFLVPGTPAGTAPAGPAPAYSLRWFTPATEVDLCGHATLAAAAYLFDEVEPAASQLAFWTRSGWLIVDRGAEGRLVLDLPADPPRALADGDPLAAAAVAALRISPVRTMKATDLIFVLPDEAAVRAVAPDLTAALALPVRGAAVTALGDSPGGDSPEADFVSRWFGGAGSGIGEDPVTGSAHCALAPYWANVLGRNRLVAAQLSARGGVLSCEVLDGRVRLTGSHRRYLSGVITLPDTAAAAGG